MKQTLLGLTILLATVSSCFSQANKKDLLSFDGFYIAKTGIIATANLDIYTYFRFYPDGSVYLQTVTSNDPSSVAAWFGKGKKFSQKGNYQLKDSTVSIHLTNKDSNDSKLEGRKETDFRGTATSDQQLCLIRDKETTVNCFSFFNVADRTTDSKQTR